MKARRVLAAAGLAVLVCSLVGSLVGASEEERDPTKLGGDESRLILRGCSIGLFVAFFGGLFWGAGGWVGLAVGRLRVG